LNSGTRYPALYTVPVDSLAWGFGVTLLDMVYVCYSLYVYNCSCATVLRVCLSMGIDPRSNSPLLPLTRSGEIPESLEIFYARPLATASGDRPPTARASAPNRQNRPTPFR